MNWNQLQYVVTIATEKSITKAAQKLYISQPSLSLSIQSLEKETGVRLFLRNHSQLELTYAGTLFYEWAKSTLQSHTQLEWKLSDIANNSRHLIRLGISPHRSTIILPPVLKKFYDLYPNCDLQIIEKPTYILKDMLQDNDVDLILDVPNPDTINYHNELLAKEEIVLALPASFAEQLPLFQTQDIGLPLSALTNIPFIMQSAEQIIGQMSRELCESASFFPNTRMVCSNAETALSLVHAQLGAAFVPGIFALQKRYEPQIQYHHINQFGDTRQLCAIYRKNIYQPVQMQALLALLKEIVPVLYGAGDNYK